MSFLHFRAVAVTLTIYFVLFVSFAGWGRLLFRLLSGNEKISSMNRYVSVCAWLGWCLILLLLQLTHLVLPIRWFVSVPIYLVGFVLGVPVVRHWTLAFGKNDQMFLKLFLVSIGLFAFWIASRAMLPINNSDSGLYHLGAIRWINTYRIIPGLGNLHGRFAFNQSFFLYAASLNLYPYFMHCRSLANSFLLLLATFTIVETIWVRSLSEHSSSTYSNLMLAVSGLMVLLYFALTSTGMRSPSPDLATTVLQIVLFMLFVAFLERAFCGQHVEHHDVGVFFVMSLSAITVKLSNMVFVVMISLAIFIVYLLYEKRLDKYLVKLSILCLSIIFVYALRGYLLSGAPLYPSLFGYTEFEWSVPRAAVEAEANWVYSWARQPHQHWSVVLGSMNWLRTWFARTLEFRTSIVFPLLIFITCMLGSLVVYLNSDKGFKKKLFHVLLLIPVFCGLIFWFFTAPAPRFAEGLFMILPLYGGYTFVSATVGIQMSVWVRRFVLLVLILFVNCHVLHFCVSKKWVFRNISTAGWHPLPVAEFTTRTTDSGLKLYIPSENDRAWDGPLPGTPYFRSNLSLRVSGDIQSGFKIQRQKSRINRWLW